MITVSFDGGEMNTLGWIDYSTRFVPRIVFLDTAYPQ